MKAVTVRIIAKKLHIGLVTPSTGQKRTKKTLIRKILHKSRKRLGLARGKSVGGYLRAKKRRYLKCGTHDLTHKRWT